MVSEVAPRRLGPGSVLADRYRLTSLLGSGGMGSVWRAEHLALRSEVAVKVMSSERPLDDAQLARFMREAQAAAALRSPHVVQILDHGVDAGIPFIAMELLDGQTLAQRLQSAAPLSPAETSRIITQVSRAVSRAHEAGVVHRDLKPDNVVLVPNDGEEVAKVLDFGIAKTQSLSIDQDAASTRTGALLGTPYYMSPEQLRGAKQLDGRADIWALGVIAFECLTGKRPFVSDSLGELVLAVCSRPHPVPSETAAVPTGFDAWFARATALEPADRFSSARELARALAEICDVAVPRTSSASAASQDDLVVAPTLPQARTAHSLAHTQAPAAARSGLRGLFIGIASAAGIGIAVWVFGMTRAAPEPEPSSASSVAPVAPAAPNAASGPAVTPALSAVPKPIPSATLTASAKPATSPSPRVPLPPKAATPPQPKQKPKPAAPSNTDVGIGF